MELIQDEIGKRDALPIAIGPNESIGVDHLGRAMNALGLQARNRIGTRAAVFKQKRVCVSRHGIGHYQIKVFAIALHR